jgi:hypothetical protein
MDGSYELLSTAERLKVVRRACIRFLLLWAMSPAKQSTAGGTAGSMAKRKTFKFSDGKPDPDGLLRALANSENPDWSFLYRGKLLDD